MTQNEPVAVYGDMGAVTIWIATFAQALPSIAAFLSVIWFLIRIAESDTVQAMLGKYRWINTKKETKNDG